VLVFYPELAVPAIAKRRLISGSGLVFPLGGGFFVEGDEHGEVEADFIICFIVP